PSLARRRPLCPLTPPPGRDTPERTPMSQAYRALLVGTGSVAESHVRAIEHTRGRVVLAGAVDIDAERLKAFCARHKVTAAHADYQAALRAVKPDIVLVAAPPALHAD